MIREGTRIIRKSNAHQIDDENCKSVLFVLRSPFPLLTAGSKQRKI